MIAEEKIKIGISIGDINGIGLEVILKTFKDSRMFDLCTPIIFGGGKLIADLKRDLNLNIPIHRIVRATQAVEGKMNVLDIWKENAELQIGKSTKEGGKYAFLSLKESVLALKEGAIDTLVTAPINKENIQSDEFKFAGHTEYLESELEGKSLMILMSGKLRVGLITGHIPISEISNAITPELIKSKVEVLYETLVKDFGISRPKIAVLGLNPHCGDNGVIGSEDEEIIRPTLNEIQNKGKLVYGPFAADGFFGSRAYEQFDGILAMYHDQGLAPFKTLSFGKGVNFTAGLSHIRTSPDHGTGFDIAGKNLADESSFKEALFTAIDVYRNRLSHRDLTQNVLKSTRREKKVY